MVMLLLRRTVLAAIAIGLLGCYSGTTYVRPTATIHRDREALVSAIEATLAAHDLRIARLEEDTGTIVALSRVDRASGVATRERWRFFVEAGAVRVEMHPEMRMILGERHRWEQTTYVCECYRYAREREMLHEVRLRAHGRAPRQLAAGALADRTDAAPHWVDAR